MFLGIDIGTTAIKFGLINKGELYYSQSIQLVTKIDGSKQTQSAKEINDALIYGIKTLPKHVKEPIDTIAFSTAMHSLLPEKNGQGDDIYIWSDNQASQSIDRFRHSLTAKAFYQETGTPIHGMSPFAKLLYMKETDMISSFDHFYGIKESVMRLFTGEVRIDRSTASATGLYALHEKTWSQKILDFLSLNKDQLAPLCEPTDCFPILPAFADELGISRQVKIMCGASDGCLAAYAGYKATGIPNSLTIGTSAAIRKVATAPAFDQEKQNFCYYLQDGVYIIGAPSNNGGSVLAWAKEVLAENPDDFYQSLPRIIEQSEIGSNGLRFSPYLNGERAPYWTNRISAGFHHLTIKHQRHDMIRATIEGMLMNVRLLKDLVQIEGRVTVSGGFFKTNQLGQMAADILGVSCCISEENEPIFGLYDLYHQTETNHLQNGNTIEPNQHTQMRYDQIAATYFEV